MAKPKKRPTPKHKYNWRPDLPDHRDFRFSEKVSAPTRLPAFVDLRPKCSPVFDQGKIGSCTGNALAGAVEYLELKELEGSLAKLMAKLDAAVAQRKPNAFAAEIPPEIFEMGTFDHVSRLFIYYNERLIEGTTDQDAGAQLRDGIKTLVNWGACRETQWKYAASQLFKKPSVAAYNEAKSHRISQYLKLGSLRELKQCLADGYPLVFGFTVYESFESPDVARTGVMPLPKDSERVLGGHAVMAVGYDDKKGQLIVRNSWGDQWGDSGYFRMPYAYIDDLQLAQDFWTVRY